MSCSDSVTLGIKAGECPHFTSVLRCSVSSMHCRDCCCFARAHCSGISNQHCECVVHYVTIAAPTILIFKGVKTRSTSAYSLSREIRTRINSVDQKFPLEPGPWEPPKKRGSSSTHSSAGAKPYLPTLTAEKRGIFQQNKPLSQHAHTDFFFFLETLWVTHRTIQSSSWADQKCKPTTKEIGSHFQAW